MNTFNYIDTETGEPLEEVYPQVPDQIPTYTEENGRKVWTLEGSGFMTPHKIVTTIGGHIDTYTIRNPETGETERWI